MKLNKIADKIKKIDQNFYGKSATAYDVHEFLKMNELLVAELTRLNPELMNHLNKVNKGNLIPCWRLASYVIEETRKIQKGKK